MDAAAVLARLESRSEGLTDEEAETKRQQFGHNVLAASTQVSLARLILHAAANPLVILLAVLATISFATEDVGAGIMMTLMIVLGMGLKLVQEARADRVAAELKAMISVTATVQRNGHPREIPVADLVPGDVITLSAGDMIPADLRILSAKDLFVTQSMLTGESIAVEKFEVDRKPPKSPLESTSIAFFGTSVESGSAHAVVVVTGKQTVLGSLAESLSNQSVQTAFDKSISRFTWLMLQFLAVMVPVVFLINGFAKHNWVDAFFFAPGTLLRRRIARRRSNPGDGLSQQPFSDGTEKRARSGDPGTYGNSYRSQGAGLREG
jgi:Mg2+-importing ATPase